MDTNLIADIKKITFEFLNAEDFKVFVFGSRATGTNLKFSDVDLGIEPKKQISPGLISRIEEAFENSNLPYKVDVVDFSKVSEKFKEVAMKDVIYLN